MSQKDKIVELLSDGREHSASEFIKMGIYKYSSRIAELRNNGIVIDSQHIRKSLWHYRLNVKGQGELF